MLLPFETGPVVQSCTVVSIYVEEMPGSVSSARVVALPVGLVLALPVLVLVAVVALVVEAETPSFSAVVASETPVVGGQTQPCEAGDNGGSGMVIRVGATEGEEEEEEESSVVIVTSLAAMVVVVSMSMSSVVVVEVCSLPIGTVKSPPSVSEPVCAAIAGVE